MGFSFALQLFFISLAQIKKPESAWIMWCALIPSFVMPAILLAFLKIRQKKVKNGLEHEETTGHDLLNELTDSITHFRTVADYYKRPLMVDKVTGDIGRFNKAVVQNSAMKTNNIAVMKWMDKIVEFSWILLGGAQVCQGSLDLGTFLATSSIFKSNSGQMSHLYNLYITINCEFNRMWHVVHFMNFPTDLFKRMANEKARLSTSETMILGKGDVPAVDFDLMEIQLKDLSFNYTKAYAATRASGMAGKTAGDDAFEKTSAVIQQGKLVAVLGAGGVGGGSLLQILGGVLIPTQGLCFVPSHLRVLHVHKEPEVLDESIAFNVFFGLLNGKNYKSPADLPEEAIKRGLEICQYLDFSAEMMKRAGDLHAGEDGSHKTLSKSERKRIHIARALIFNPEVLAIQLPTQSFDLFSKFKTLACLREFVDGRGLCVQSDGANKAMFRPRTCVFTTGDPKELQDVDYVLCLESDKTKKRLTELIRPDMLRKGAKMQQTASKPAEDMYGAF